MKIFKSLFDWKIILISLLIFNLLPLFMFMDNDLGGIVYGIGSLIVVNPVYLFALNLFTSQKKDFNILFPLEIVLLFIPSVFIFYNSSALAYVAIYLVIAYIAVGIGTLIKMKLLKTKEN